MLDEFLIDLHSTLQGTCKSEANHNASRETTHLTHVPDLEHADDGSFERKTHIRGVTNGREKVIND